MRILAIPALLLVAALAVPSVAASKEPPVQVEFVQCVTFPCPPQVTCTPANDGIVERNADCSHRVSVDFIDCLWGEHWVTYTVGPVTVRYTACNSPA